MKREVEVTYIDLFKELDLLGFKVRRLASMVQNDMPCPPKEELLQWAADVNDVTDKLQGLKKDVIRYYLEK